ncbi:hypothetical protein QBC39DRAFT_131148 [Podospora conica]|nr:hypothetical protein QBC39DRAFT_131148 [Schizothecium conicum]
MMGSNVQVPQCIQVRQCTVGVFGLQAGDDVDEMRMRRGEARPVAVSGSGSGYNRYSVGFYSLVWRRGCRDSGKGRLMSSMDVEGVHAKFQFPAHGQVLGILSGLGGWGEGEGDIEMNWDTRESRPFRPCNSQRHSSTREPKPALARLGPHRPRRHQDNLQPSRRRQGHPGPSGVSLPSAPSWIPESLMNESSSFWLVLSSRVQSKKYVRASEKRVQSPLDPAESTPNICIK